MGVVPAQYNDKAQRTNACLCVLASCGEPRHNEALCALRIIQREAPGAVFLVGDIVLETGWVAMATAPQGLVPPTSRQPACQPVLPAVTGSLRVSRAPPTQPSPAQRKTAPQIPIPQTAFESENITLRLAGLNFS